TGAGRPGPQIREVRFFECKDPVADFAHPSAPLHLLLDAQPQDFARFKQAKVNLRPTLPSRRIYFLAVNHREPLLADVLLRRALAAGIDRARLLADYFGGAAPPFRSAALMGWSVPLPSPPAGMSKQARALHHTLNGPFPAGSWAVSTDDRVPQTL